MTFDLQTCNRLIIYYNHNILCVVWKNTPSFPSSDIMFTRLWQFNFTRPLTSTKNNRHHKSRHLQIKKKTYNILWTHTHGFININDDHECISFISHLDWYGDLMVTRYGDLWRRTELRTHWHVLYFWWAMTMVNLPALHYKQTHQFIRGTFSN